MTDTSKKSRKKNFSLDEERVLREKYAERKTYLTSSLTNKVTNDGKNSKWKEIADAINALGHEMRTVAEVKSKWKNMASKAKETFHQYRKSQQQTGGGPPVDNPSESVLRTIEILKDGTSFKGIEGGFSSFRENAPPQHVPSPIINSSSEDEESEELEEAPPVSSEIRKRTHSDKVENPREVQVKVLRQEGDLQALRAENLKLKNAKIKMEMENLRLENERVKLNIQLLKKMLADPNEMNWNNIISTSLQGLQG